MKTDATDSIGNAVLAEGKSGEGFGLTNFGERLWLDRELRAAERCGLPRAAERLRREVTRRRTYRAFWAEFFARRRAGRLPGDEALARREQALQARGAAEKRRCLAQSPATEPDSKKQGLPWTRDELAQLWLGSVAEVAARLGRSAAAVGTMRNARHSCRNWSAAEVAQLWSASLADVAKRLGRSEASIKKARLVFRAQRPQDGFLHLRFRSWTNSEISRLWTGTIDEVAEKLGRTRAAVAIARSKFKALKPRTAA